MSGTQFVLCLIFGALGAISHQLISASDGSGCGEVNNSQWRQAPHEQQPEPMMAKQGFSVERWVL